MALVPAVLWAIVLVVALVTLPPDYLLSVYVLLALNFAGSSGDFVEVYVVSKEPQDALFKDDGNQLHVFVPGVSS